MYMGDSIVEVKKCSYRAKFENFTAMHRASFLSDSLFGTLIAENFRYLTDVGLHDAITIMSLIFTFEP